MLGNGESGKIRRRMEGEVWGTQFGATPQRLWLPSRKSSISCLRQEEKIGGQPFTEKWIPLH